MDQCRSFAWRKCEILCENVVSLIRWEHRQVSLVRLELVELLSAWKELIYYCEGSRSGKKQRCRASSLVG